MQRTGSLIDAILTDHAEMQELFELFVEAEGDERTEIWRDIVRLLATHETAEEEIVYPSLRRDDPSGAVGSRLAEEDAAKKMLADLDADGPDSAGFDDRFREFAGIVLNHASHEESEIIPRLRSMDPERATMMGRAFEAAKAVAPTRGHRLAPESATGNLVVGPALAIMDRARDAIRRVLDERKR